MGEVGGVLLTETEQLKVNQRITAQWLSGPNKRKYPAKMRHKNRDGTYVVWYDDGNVRFDVTRDQISTDLTPQQSAMERAEQKERKKKKQQDEAEEAEKKKRELDKRIRKKVGRKSHWGLTVADNDDVDEKDKKFANTNIKVALEKKRRERMDIDVKKPQHLLMTTAGPLPPKMVGWLEKRENRLWKKRYCWLEDNNYMLYSKGPEHKVLGKVNFSSTSANIRTTADETEFFVEVDETVNYFRGANIHVRNHWLH